MPRDQLLALLEVIRSCHFGGAVVPFPVDFHGDDQELAEHIVTLSRLLDDEDKVHVARMWRVIQTTAGAA